MNLLTWSLNMHPSIISRSLLVVFVSMLAACAVTPPYTPTPNDKLATVQLAASSEATMCRNGELYKISAPAGTSEARIPSGERISLGTFMQYSGYNVTYSCYPFLSFVPKEGGKYVLHNFVQGDKCIVELVGLDDTRSTGVIFEPSIRPRDCFKAK
jgi:hypothetical protein